MPDTTKRRGGGVHLVFGALVGLVVGVALQARGRRPAAESRPIWKPAEPPPPAAVVVPLQRRRRAVPVRLAVAAVYAVLFFAGAAVAAVAGDEIAGGGSTSAAPTTAPAPLDAGADPAPADTPAAPDDPAPADPVPTAPVQAAPVQAAPAPGWTMPSEPTPAVPAPVEPAPAEAAPADSTAPAPAEAQPASTDTAPSAPAASADPASTAPADPSAPAPAPVAPVAAAPAPAAFAKPAPVHSHKTAPRRPVATPGPDASEAPASAFPTPYASLTWISRFAPPAVPQPPLLTRLLGRDLFVAAKRADATWPLVLGVLGARGEHATPAAVRQLAPRVGAALAQHGDDWAAALAVLGDSAAADRAIALMHFDHAVGLETLVTGLDASKQRLVRRVLDDPRISIYAGGRDDLAAGHVDVRVVAVIAYLADTFGTVEVSSLVSGHRLYARPGVVSAHVYGDAVDIAALGGVAIEGHQQPGGITEKAVRALLLLPQRMEPAQVISLLGLGGPSFPLADHYDHIHVGF